MTEENVEVLRKPEEHDRQVRQIESEVNEIEKIVWH